MTISAERREAIASALDREDSFKDALKYCNFSRSELRTLLHDSARLERAQKVVDDLKNDPDPEMRDVGHDIKRAIVDTGGDK